MNILVTGSGGQLGNEMQIKGWSRLKKDMPVLSLFACPELVEGEDGIRLAYEDFLENPMRAER